MSSLDINLMAAIIHEKDWLRVQDKGIRGNQIEGQFENDLWKFIYDYYQEYRTTPAPGIIKEKYDVDLPIVDESLNYWIAEIKRRTLFNEMNEKFIFIQEKLGKDDSVGAYNELRDFVKTKELELSNELSIKPVIDMKDEFLRKYDDAKAGKRGIDTPWSAMDEWTNGWWAKDLSFFVGRSGTGKSFIMIALAMAAIKAGKNVLLISCEMSIEDMVSRYFAMEFKKEYSAIRKGRLSFFEENRLRELVSEFQQPTNKFQIMDAERGMDVIRVERAIEKTKADIVLIDSAYRIRARQKARDRFEAFAYVVDDLKMFAQMYRLPIIASTQLNRQSIAKKGGRMGQEDIAMTDVISWNSTNIFGLSKPPVGETLEEKEKAKEFPKLWIHPVKIREGENEEKTLVINWDFKYMNFSQIGLADQESNEQTYKKKDEDIPW